MTSERKIAANRANAQNCTGPKSERGKGLARFNATKHGLFAVQSLLPGEDRKKYERLATSIRADTNPKTAIEELLVDQITADMWRLHRVEKAEDGYIDEVQSKILQKILDSLSDEEFELAKRIVEDQSALIDSQISRAQAKARLAEAERQAALYSYGSADDEYEDDGDESTSLGETEAVLVDLEHQKLQNEAALQALMRKLNSANDLGKLLLHGLASSHSSVPYSKLDEMRRSLLRDILQKYAQLLQLQQSRMTIELKPSGDA